MIEKNVNFNFFYDVPEIRMICGRRDPLLGVMGKFLVCVSFDFSVYQKDARF